MMAENKSMADERRKRIRQQFINLHGGKVFPPAEYGEVAEGADRKR
jgi:hypothetical protein